VLLCLLCVLCVLCMLCVVYVVCVCVLLCLLCVLCVLCVVKRFRDGLKAVTDSGEYREAKFSYAVVKTLRLVGIEIRDLDNANAWSDAYKAFNKEREALALECAKKDKDGKPQTVRMGDGVGYPIGDEKKYKPALKKLEKKHAKAVKEKEEGDAKHKKFREEPAETKIHTIPQSLMPKTISAKHLDGIFELFED